MSSPVRTRPLFAAALSALVLVLGTRSARAEPDRGPEQAADTAFTEGRTLLAQGNLARACERFAESDRLSPSGRAVLNLADCLERRGMFASAQARFLEAATRAGTAGLAEIERHARERAGFLDARMPKIRFVVGKAVDTSGLEVTRDGKPLPSSEWNKAEPFDPGTVHTFEATAPGHAAFRVSITAEEGQTKDVALRWSGATGAAGGAWSTHPSAQESSSLAWRPVGSSSTSRPNAPLAWGAIGTGAAASLVGLIASWQVLAAKGTMDAHCQTATRTCDDEGFAATSRGATFEVVAPVAFALGAVAIGVGTYLLFHDDRSRDRDHRREARGGKP